MAISPLDLILVAQTLLSLAGAAAGGAIGVNYGRLGDDLPPPEKVAQLLVAQGVSQVKLYDADPAVLSALSGTGIGVVIALPNELLTATAANPSFAQDWVKNNVAAWLPNTQIRAIAVGNEVFASPIAANLTPALVPAMANIHRALADADLDGSVKISSPLALTALQTSYPPSAGAFQPDLATSIVAPMLDLLRRTGSYLMVNAYPFFAYSANSGEISIDYALFRPNSGDRDPASGLLYYSLLDAQLDAVYSAMAALGYGDLRLVVSETGWPSKGDEGEIGASPENAAAYNGNLANRILAGDGGTPARPLAELDVFLFALFNENSKPGPSSERNYGLFYPSEDRVYEVAFRLERATAAVRDQVEGGAASWCVAAGLAEPATLQAALDFACGDGGVDCGAIEPGGECFEPNTLEAHASFAFNGYYQKNRREPSACDFHHAAVVVRQPPEFGPCAFPAGN
ncbi:glucan endo-1,3-beta-glucosidase 7-like [Wolffia australiana]